MELPLTDICSKYFWKTIPTTFHTFDTIVAINNKDDDHESVLDPESESNV
jgi:hypothetical protein